MIPRHFNQFYVTIVPMQGGNVAGLADSLQRLQSLKPLFFHEEESAVVLVCAIAQEMPLYIAVFDVARWLSSYININTKHYEFRAIRYGRGFTFDSPARDRWLRVETDLVAVGLHKGDVVSLSSTRPDLRLPAGIHCGPGIDETQDRAVPNPS